MDHLHVPVLLEEVRHGLQPAPEKVMVDGTLGLGGHASMLLEGSAGVKKLLGIERDPKNLEDAKRNLAKFKNRVILVHGNYRDLGAHLRTARLEKVDGILLDLGFSSVHVDDASRGFSFQTDGPLDMRYDQTEKTSAANIVNEWSEGELADLFRRYGEEPKAKQIAKAIVTARQKKRVERTTELVSCIETVVKRTGRLHPATRVFQALRMVVNDELGALSAFLPQAVTALNDGGRIAIITFHSLEDRIVKQYFKTSPELFAITKRPVVASREEIQKNPRARSAKLRVAERKDKKQTYDHANGRARIHEPDNPPNLAHNL